MSSSRGMAPMAELVCSEMCIRDSGWVVREPCQGDRRGVLLTLTPTGAAKVEQIAPVHLDQVRAHLVDRLSAEQFATLGGAMENVMSGLDGFADSDGRAPNDRY